MRAALGTAASTILRVSSGAVSAPSNTVAPALSTTTAVVGVELTVTTGTWTGTPTSYSYNWKADGVSLGAADANAYTPTPDDYGAVISCTVTATNAGGSTPANSNNSSAVVYVRTAFVSSTGNNATAALNDPALPFEQAGPAITALEPDASVGVCSLRFLTDYLFADNFVLTEGYFHIDGEPRLKVIGVGGVRYLNLAITGTGTAGADGSFSPSGPGGAGSDGQIGASFTADSVTILAVDVSGGNGGNGGNSGDDVGGNGGAGGAGGNIILLNGASITTFVSNGGTGGLPGSGPGGDGIAGANGANGSAT